MHHIYLDESGDLGWTFDKPYRNGGSSRFLTIGCVITPLDEVKKVNRLVKKLYKAFQWNPLGEMKWASMSSDQRKIFAEKVKTLQSSSGNIEYASITVRKSNVIDRMKNEPNLLYNYMSKLLLLQKMAQHDEVRLICKERDLI
jgi:hypothetical protein